MSENAWLTVSTLPSTMKTLAFIVPNDQSLLAQLRGALVPLIYPENYERFGLLTPEENSDYWRDIILEFFEEKPMFYPGFIMIWAGGIVPEGWLLCDGSLYSVDDYPDLREAIGFTFGGNPDPGVEFGVPDLRGLFPVGWDTNSSEFSFVGQSGGVKTVTLTTNQIPSHTHTQNSHNHTQNSHNHTQNAHDHTVWANQVAGGGSAVRNPAPSSGSHNVTSESVTAVNVAATAVNVAATAVNQSTGGGGSHNNLPPYLTLNFIIKT